MVLVSSISCADFSQSDTETRGSDELSQKTISQTQLDELGEALATWVAEYQAADEIPGLAVALVYQDQVLLLEGMGSRDLAQELPVTPHTLFHIGSTHKSITALLAAIAVDRGLLAWEQPIVEFAPEFELRDPDATEMVNMRHLLSMRSGISDDAVDFDLAEIEALDLFDQVADAELLGEPGGIFDYSNVSVSLGGYLVAFAAQSNMNTLEADHEALLTEWILDPIGMKDARLQLSDAQTSGDVALPYVWAGDRFVVAEREDFDDDPLSPSGGLKASINDMAAYLITQVQGGVAPDGSRIVSTSSLQATWQPRWGSYAMGWEQENYQGVVLLSHGGLYDNFLSIIGIVPEYELGFVVLTNSSDAAEGLIGGVAHQVVELTQELEL
ncbi:MAG: beta-lactamase family protein [Spirulina sp. SIO3F2]|nr:beta-lactamase family protein [Spirulina sp. SIO3F2]